MKKAINFGLAHRIRFTREQQYKSKSGQRKTNNEYAVKNGFQVVLELYEYFENCVLTESNIYQRLLDEVDKRKVQAVIISSVRRVFPNVAGYFNLTNELSKRNVRLISVKEGDLTKNKFTGSVLASLSQFFEEAK